MNHYLLFEKYFKYLIKTFIYLISVSKTRVGLVLAKTGPVSVLGPVLSVFGLKFEDRSGPRTDPYDFYIQ